jgi:GDP-L-fucose synthase
MGKILVTGGSGLVGRCFTGDRFEKISSKNGDLRDREVVSSIIRGSDYEGIIHCAARVGGVKSNMSYPGEFFHDNIMMNTNMIEEARKAGIKKFIFYSSTCVFPDKVVYPLTPDKVHLGPPHNSNYAYAYAKRMGQVQIQAYNQQYGLDYFTVIPSNIYGPGDFYNIEDGHVIPSLLHKMYLAHRDNTDFIVWGSGAPLREFIFSEDIAEITTGLYDNYRGKDPVIVSASEEISIKDLVYLMAKIFGFKGNIVFDTSKPEGQLRKPSDNSIIKNIFPDFKFTPIEEGLEKSISWFMENYSNIRK